MMSDKNKITEYADVNQILVKLQAGVKRILRDELIGIYLHGSLALGDFDPASSDIDFIVLTDNRLSDETIHKLKEMHYRLNDYKWGKRLEGSYLPANTLQYHEPPEPPRPYFNGGEFSSPRYGYEWVLERHVLLDKGIVLEGPPLSNFIDPILPEKIRNASMTILNEWWIPMLKDNTHIEDSEYQAYAILTMCRVIFTLHNSTIVSKLRAAKWMKERFADKWTPIIDQALAWQNGQSLDLLPESLELIQFTRQLAGMIK